jgi:hypothetical protein
MLVALLADMAQSAETQGGEVLGKKRERAGGEKARALIKMNADIYRNIPRAEGK